MSDSEKTGIEVVEFGNTGNTLPIGVIEGGKIQKGYSLKPLAGAEEKEIGRWKGENEGAPITLVVSKVLAVLLDTLGGQPFDSGIGKGKVEEEKALLKIGRLYVPDVWQIYARARMNEFGSEYAIPFQCPNPQCEMSEKEVRLAADLNKMDVHMVNDPKLLQKRVQLRRGFRFRDNSMKKAVTITPMLWANMTTKEALVALGNETLLKLHHVKKCVTNVEDFEHSVTLEDSEIDSMPKIDIEVIAKEINDINIGPKMVAEGECKCGFKFNFPLNWEYEHFFAISSLC